MKQMAPAAYLLSALILFFATFASAGTVTDIDGNVYQTVTIGTQVWMAENLRVTHYNNGDSIPHVIADSTTWTGLTTGASCAYDNDQGNVAIYGRIYNWYAGTDARSLAPAGWHVPSDTEFKQLEMFLGMPEANVNGTGNRGGFPVGAKLKEVGTTHWTCPNTGSTNETGFSALPGGSLDNRPVFSGFGTDVLFWTSTEHNLSTTAAWARDITCNLSSIGRNGFAKDYGGSVRCVRDAPAGIEEEGGAKSPFGFGLVQNYPNPFNPSTSIEYRVPARSEVRIEVFNALGRYVVTLVAAVKGAGTYRTEWNGTDASGKQVSTGVYLYRLKAGSFVETKKMLLVK